MIFNIWTIYLVCNTYEQTILKKNSDIKSNVNISMIEIFLHFDVPDNQISLHLDVPDNQISLHLGVPDNQI